jgi:hypothetical protein
MSSFFSNYDNNKNQNEKNCLFVFLSNTIDIIHISKLLLGALKSILLYVPFYHIVCKLWNNKENNC